MRPSTRWLCTFGRLPARCPASKLGFIANHVARPRQEERRMRRCTTIQAGAASLVALGCTAVVGVGAAGATEKPPGPDGPPTFIGKPAKPNPIRGSAGHPAEP